MGYDKSKLAGAALLNTPAAGSVDTTTIPGKLVIGKMNPIELADIKKIHPKIVYAAEQRQVLSITIPTVVAATKYAIIFNGQDNENENHSIGDLPIRARIEALTGTAAIDKLLIGLQWVRALRQNRGLNVDAGVRATIDHATGAFTVGEEVVGVTSGARGIVRSGGSATAAVIDIYSGQFSATENITQPTTGITRLANTITYTGKVFVTDDAGYFALNTTRKGKSSISPGLNVVTVTEETAAVYGFGAGADVVKMVPIMNQNDNNLASGSLGFPTYEAPVASNNYNMYVIETSQTVDNTSISSVGGAIPKRYEVWYKTDAVDVAAFETAIEALV